MGWKNKCNRWVFSLCEMITSGIYLCCIMNGLIPFWYLTSLGLHTFLPIGHESRAILCRIDLLENTRVGWRGVVYAWLIINLHQPMENEQQLQHESSTYFCFSRDECGNLRKQCIIDRLATMVENEQDIYNYNRFLSRHDDKQTRNRNPMLIVDIAWRASIVKWSYNVVDYFDLSREVVALSMSLCKYVLYVFFYK